MSATVLYLVDGLGLSGKTKAMVDLCVGLDPTRYRAHVVCFDKEGSPLAERLAAAGVPIDEIPCPEGLNMRVVARITALALRLRPEVIHCYNPRTMLYGGLCARGLGIGALGSLSAFACLTPDGDHVFLPQKLFSASLRNRWRNRFACGLVRRVVTVSETLGRNFCRYNHVDESRLRVISYGVDPERFARVTTDEIGAFRARHEVPPGAVLVMSVGRLVEQKDYPTQLRAFARAAAANPALFMLLVGDGPLRTYLEGLVAELGIGARVRFAGHSNEVPIALRAADIFVIASKFEPYGVAILEAKAAGAPIVATRVNEIPEILGGDTGVVVPPADPEAMGDAFARLAADAPARQALGRRAAEDAVRRHSLAHALSTYQDLYDEARGAPRRELHPAGAF